MVRLHSENLQRFRLLILTDNTARYDILSIMDFLTPRLSLFPPRSDKSFSVLGFCGRKLFKTVHESFILRNKMRQDATNLPVLSLNQFANEQNFSSLLLWKNINSLKSLKYKETV